MEYERSNGNNAAREYLGGGIAGSAISGAKNPVANSSSELERIVQRIEQATMNARILTESLMSHADRVHGPEAEACGGEDMQDVRRGILGSIFDALDRLDRAQTTLAEQAGRNCMLA